MKVKLRPARTWQNARSPLREMMRAGAPKIRRDVREALKHLAECAPEGPLLHDLRAGQWWLVKERIRWHHFGEVLKVPFARIGELREVAQRYGVAKINGAFHGRGRRVRYRKADEPRHHGAAETMPAMFSSDLVDMLGGVAKAIGDRFAFDRYNQATQDRVRAAQDRLIRELTDASRDTVDGIVSAGVQTGLRPEQIVDDIRDMIGLTRTQSQAVMNYRRMLETLDPDALRRQLRNVDLDDDVRAAIRDGAPLERAFIDQAVREYEDNYLTYRAEAISQTEATRAVNDGLHDSYQQAIDRGALPEDATRRHWTVALDERTCPVCLSIPENNLDGVLVTESFQSIDGPVDDPPIHPNCRCSVDYITDLDKVPDDGGIR